MRYVRKVKTLQPVGQLNLGYPPPGADAEDTPGDADVQAGTPLAPPGTVAADSDELIPLHEPEPVAS